MMLKRPAASQSVRGVASEVYNCHKTEIVPMVDGSTMVPVRTTTGTEAMDMGLTVAMAAVHLLMMLSPTKPQMLSQTCPLILLPKLRSMDSHPLPVEVPRDFHHMVIRQCHPRAIHPGDHRSHRQDTMVVVAVMAEADSEEDTTHGVVIVAAEDTTVVEAMTIEEVMVVEAMVVVVEADATRSSDVYDKTADSSARLGVTAQLRASAL
jgi:hypothetical protein